MTLGADATKTERRVWLVIWPGDSDDRPRIDVRFTEPDVTGALAVIRCVGQIAAGALISLDVEGQEGPAGWTPALAGEQDGTRTLLKVADWTGGRGTKPPIGYIGPVGTVAAKAAAFNFNAVKRVHAFSAVSNAAGIATIPFNLSPGFASPPALVVLPAQPNLVVGGTKSELVANSLTKDGCQVKVTGAALLSSLVVALAGATANVLAIET